MKKFTFLTALLITFCGTLAEAGYLPPAQTRGVWISQNYLTGGHTAIETMIRNLSAANINVIYVEVYTHGMTIYPSAVMQNAGGILQNPTFQGTDPLKTVIEIAHKYGIQVFAWFASPLLLSQASSSSQVPPILVKNPSWTAVPRDTTDRFYPPHNGSPYSFEMDPCVSGAADFVVNLETECARNHPGIDGIETDIENDTTGWYGDSTRALFMKETGNPDPLTLPDLNQAWLAWRQLQVTNLIRRIYQSIKSVNPDCIVSAAVPPPYMSAYTLESWTVWADDGYVDAIEPLLYLSPSSFNTELLVSKTYVPGGFQLFPGVAVNSAGSFSNAVSEMKDAIAGDPGVVIWYYGYLIPSPGSFAALKSDIFSLRTIPTFDDRIVDNYGAGEFHTTGSWTTQRGGLGGYGGTYLAAPAVRGDTAVFSGKILCSGDYDLYGYWPGDSSANCSHVVVQTIASGFSKLDTVNQKLNIGSWSYVDRFYLDAGENVTIKLSGTGGGNLIANAFRLRRGNRFVLSDYAVPDSETILLKFSNPLRDPVSRVTSVATLPAMSGINFYVDPVDNTILHVSVPVLQQDVPFTLNVKDLVDNSYDTLSFSQALDYDPDSTALIVDDLTQGLFSTLSGIWIQDTSSSAINGEYWLAKQGVPGPVAKWGPLEIKKGGYYDVYAHIPQSQAPLSKRCFYVVQNDIGTDTVYVSQQSNAGKWINLGSFPLSTGGEYSVWVSSAPGANPADYIVADALMLNRSVEVTGVKTPVANAAGKFYLSDNYPNPFNPSTTISITLARSGMMSLKIYNVLGQLVKVVTQGDKAPGVYTCHVYMDNLASGVYFYTLEQGSNVMTKKMLLLK